MVVNQTLTRGQYSVGVTKQELIDAGFVISDAENAKLAVENYVVENFTNEFLRNLTANYNNMIFNIEIQGVIDHGNEYRVVTNIEFSENELEIENIFAVLDKIAVMPAIPDQVRSKAWAIKQSYISKKELISQLCNETVTLSGEGAYDIESYNDSLKQTLADLRDELKAANIQFSYENKSFTLLKIKGIENLLMVAKSFDDEDMCFKNGDYYYVLSTKRLFIGMDYIEEIRSIGENEVAHINECYHFMFKAVMAKGAAA